MMLKKPRGRGRCLFAVKMTVYIRSPVSNFVILKLNLILDGLILLRKGDICCEVRLCDGFWGQHFRRCALDVGNPYLNSTTILFDTPFISIF